MRHAAFAAGMIAASICPAFAQSPAKLDLTLTPRSAGDRVRSIDVEMRIAAPGADATRPFLLAPEQLDHVDGPAYDRATLTIRDSNGDVPFAVDDQRRITAGRATVGDVTVRYRAPAHIVTRPPFPPYDLRAEGRSAIGAGMTFLTSPLDTRTYTMRLNWDLSNMPRGAFGVWSYGEGTVAHTGPATDLINTYYAAGPLYHYSKGPLGIYWGVETPFDARAMSADFDRLFRYYTGFFGSQPTSYRAFLRRNVNGGSGGALDQSFLFDYDSQRADPAEIRQTLAHEMTHEFVGLWPGQRWFDEGMADHYASVLAVRAGVISIDAFLRTLNQDADNYYPIPIRTMSAATAATDPEAEGLYYGRARIYISHLNDLIRKASNGRRSMDDVVHSLIDRRRRGVSHQNEAFVSLLRAELGDAGVRAHEDFLAGKLVVPASDAFGPCFQRVRTDIGRFDLGFDHRPAGAPKPVVLTDLRPGSPGARAGLQADDEMINLRIGTANHDPEARVVVKVRRNGKIIQIGYVPRSDETIDTYHWVRIAGVADDACNI